jgi:hypothetical protein
MIRDFNNEQAKLGAALFLGNLSFAKDCLGDRQRKARCRVGWNIP